MSFQSIIRFTCLVAILLVVFTYQTFAQEVKLVGNTASIMLKKDLSAKLNLDTVSNRKFLYGIGAVENLQGEVLIVNGKALVSELNEDRNPIWTETWDRKLIFLASAPVQNWKKIKMDQPIANRQELEALVFDYAQKEGLDVENGFPFRVKVMAKEIQAHIAYLKPETVQNFTPQGKKADDFPIRLENEPVRIIGFAGKTEGGRFTMPAMPGREASPMHMHFVTPDFSRSGHVEELKIEGMWQLCLPDNR